MKKTQTKHPDPEMLDPDVRFLLANERTLLAWVRTGLTLQAGGFALAHFSTNNTASSQIAGIIAIVSGGVIAVVGYNRYKAADRAIRNHQLPETGVGPAIEVITVVVIALLLSIIQIIGFTRG